MLVRSIRFFLRKMKHVEAESWIVKPADSKKTYQQVPKDHLNIKNFRDIKQDYTRKSAQALQPVSPHSGPIIVEHPKAYDKIYRWCSCGQSLKQPFCDGSHEGTDFKPFKFTVEETVKDISLCGCKLTSNKPFCDGQACKQLKTNPDSEK